MKNLLRKLGIISPEKTQDKEASELNYWKKRKEEENKLRNDHYKYFYTTNFELSDEFFDGKKILDIGCGPRGSLEWANMAKERVGLDPLADEYLKLGAENHKMKYVKAYSEEIPFDDNYFDIICTFNSIDHVESIEKSCSEIQRVLKHEGMLLMLVDVHEEPTVNEPHAIQWNFVEEYFPKMELVSEEHYEKLDNGIYDSIKKKIPFDHNNTQNRYGIIAAKLKKVE